MMVTLTGTFTRLDGTPATGTVRVTPSRSPIMDPQGRIVISGPQTFPLDKDGKLAFQIPASNDPDLGPPFTYTVEALLSHKPWKISKVWIPHGSTTVDLSEIGDYTPTPGVATRVVTIPADGADGQVLVWDGAGFSWDFPPEGPRGPKGDLDAEQLAGAPRLTNLLHDMWWVSSTTTIHLRTSRLAQFTAIQPGGFIRWDENIPAGAIYYFTGEVKATSDQVFLGADQARAYHPGSGDWERLTGEVTPTGDTFFVVRDQRESGWDQVEVRDPVLIDLTAVFGAGREPTKEYMDELLAKHGHYIGAVDQFAVGDALQALTVAGPGLTLRHDNSVGERVFLDHPGGSTMIHGDTGWRDVADLLQPGVLIDRGVRYVRIRNLNGIVHFHGNIGIDPNTMVDGQIINLPSGWGPGKYGTWGASSWGASSISAVATTSSDSMIALRGWTNQATGTFSASWPATYPTTLIGEPA